jgi:hypothetical protein
MRNIRFQNVVFAVALVFSTMFLLPATYGQDVAGMTGEVSDKSGAAITGVEVTLKNATTGFKLIEFTNSIGFYRFAQIPPGQGYEADFKAKGFTPLVVRDIYLTVATVRTQNATLTVGARTDVVQVTASASEVTINTTDATIGNTFDVDQLNSLPVQQRNDPIALFMAQPGVTETGSVTGARVDQNNVTVDGLDVNDFVTGNAAMSNTGLGVQEGFGIVGHAPVDSLEEFHVTVGGNQASAGPGGGGQFQLETKSGTNHFHGNLNEYHRDPDLVANSWFNKNSTPIVPRNHLIQNQFGGNVGGPIILPKLFNGHDRAFFFFDYNNSKIIRQIDTQRTVPLDTFRGDYAGGAQLGYIDETSTPGAVSVSYLTPAEVTAIDPGGIGIDTTWTGTSSTTGSNCPPTATATMNYSCRFPHSNNTVTGDGVNSGGLLFNAPDTDYQTNYVGRVDVNLNDKMKMFARFTIARENTVENPNEFPGDPISNPFIDRTYSFVIGHTWVIGANKTNRVIIGEVVEKYAFPNTYNPDGSTFYEFSDGTGPAMASNLYLNPNSQSRRVPIPVLGDDFSWTKGTHTWQFGGTFKDILVHNTNIADYNVVEVGMGGYVLALCGGGGSTCGAHPSLRPYNSGNASKSLYYAPGSATPAETTLQNQAQYDYDNAFGFILGRLANDDSDFNYNAHGTALPQLTGDQRFFRNYQTQLYVQDTWKITPSVTATYGLTYQKFSVPYETRGLETVEPFTGDQYMAARESQSALGQTGPMAVPLIPYLLGGQVNHGPPLYPPEWKNLAPHVGIAYNPGFDKKLVFNAGAGIIYDRTIVSAVQLTQDLDSYLFQLSAPLSFGISGDPYDTFADVNVGELGPRLDSSNGISNISSYIVPPTTPVPPYQPYVSGGVPYGLQIGYAFNATLDPSLKTPFNIIFNAGMQRTMPWDMVVKLSYAGRLGRRLLAQTDVNQVLDFPDNTGLSTQTLAQAFASVTTQLRAGATAATIVPQPFFEDIFGAGYTQFLVTYFGPFAQRGDFGDAVQFMADTGAPLNLGSAAQFSENTFYGNKGFSSYNAMLLTLTKNMSHGLHFDFNYTWQHSIDNISSFANSAGDTGIGGIGLVCDVIRPRECRANSDFQEKSIITSDATYALPFGKGKTFLNDISFWENELVGGWELSGITSWHSGQAWGTSSNAFVASYSNSAPGILIGPKSAVQTHVKYLPGGGVNLFANQANAAAAYEGPIGFHIGARNGLVGPRFFDEDLGLGKAFPIWDDKVNLKFRADAFNAFNHPNFSLPGNNVYNGLDQQDITNHTFGDVSYTVEPSGNYNNGARVLQLSLRLQF